jgi:hypothetical protein
MTLSPAAHSIGTVPARTSAAYVLKTARIPRPMLTRRRAVDFCRVATALCQAACGSSRSAASRSCGAAS